MSHPNIPTGEVTIVSAEVMGWTEMWEASPESANHTLQSNQEVRHVTCWCFAKSCSPNCCLNIIQVFKRLLNRHHGYHADTQGQTFTFTFSSAADAMLWACSVQKALLAKDLPPEFQNLSVMKKGMSSIMI